MAQRPRRLSAAAAPRPADHHWRGPLSRDQDPQPARHPPARSAAPWRQPRRRLDGQKQIHHAVLTTFHLSDSAYGLNQLRYDLRKLKGHGLLEGDGSRYAYRLTPKGIQVALLFLFFHKRLCGPLAHSCFHHRPDPAHRPESKLEAAYHKADRSIQNIVELLAAA